MEDSVHAGLLELSATIVSTYVTQNKLTVEELPDLIQAVYAALRQTSSNPGRDAAQTRQEPAVPIKRSVFPDYIVCLEDGKELKMLRRHLSARYGMTIEDYRTKWGLPASYPAVAPNYAAQRSELARRTGLGHKQQEPSPAPDVTLPPTCPRS